MSQALTRFLHRLAPRLEMPPEGEEPDLPPPGQRRLYYASGVLTFVLGCGIGYSCYALTGFTIGGAELQMAPSSGGDPLSGLFLGLGLAPWLAIIVARWMLRPESFWFYRHRYAERNGGADIVVFSRWISAVMLVLVTILHLMLRDMYVAADRDKLYWSDFFDVGRSEVAWTEVKELRLVRLLKPLVGSERDRLHLVWVLEDGRRVKALEGNSTELKPEEIRAAAAYTQARGVPVVRVERDE